MTLKQVILNLLQDPLNLMENHTMTSHGDTKEKEKKLVNGCLWTVA